MVGRIARGFLTVSAVLAGMALAPVPVYAASLGTARLGDGDGAALVGSFLSGVLGGLLLALVDRLRS